MNDVKKIVNPEPIPVWVYVVGGAALLSIVGILIFTEAGKK